MGRYEYIARSVLQNEHGPGQGVLLSRSNAGALERGEKKLEQLSDKAYK